MHRVPTSATLVIGIIAIFELASMGCKDKREQPVVHVPGPIVPQGKVESARKALHDDLELAAQTLCRREPALGKTLPGDGSKKLAELLADRQLLEACANHSGSSAGLPRPAKTGRDEQVSKPGRIRKTGDRQPVRGRRGVRSPDMNPSPCRRIRRRLRRALAHEVVCSPFALTTSSGDRPPQVRRAVRFVDVLLDDALRIAVKSPKQALNRLLLVAALLEDFQRGPVPWTVAVNLTNIWPKLGEAFAKVLSRNRRPSERLSRNIASLRRSLPGIKSVLLGEHLKRLAAAGLLPGRVDLSGNLFPALKSKPTAELDARASADHRDLALILTRHFYQRAVEGCKGRPLAICRTALEKIAQKSSSNQALEELHRTFLVRFQSFDQFRYLVMSLSGMESNRKQTEDQAAARYWSRLVTWARPWNESTLALLARPGFVLAAIGYHAKVMSFVSKHPTRAFYSQVAPLVFSFSEPFSGKPIVAKPSGRTIEVTPPTQASDLKVSPYVIRLKR